MEPSTRCFRKQPRDVRTERISSRTVQRRLVRKNFANGCRTRHSGNRRPLMQYHDHHESDSFPPKNKTPRTATPKATHVTPWTIWSRSTRNPIPTGKPRSGTCKFCWPSTPTWRGVGRGNCVGIVAIVLRLHSVKGLTTANIASQLGCTESQLERSCSRFKRLLPADGVPRDFGIPVTATAPTISRTALNANGFILP